MTRGLNSLTVMLADDEPLARDYLEELLKGMPDIEVVGSFKNGGEILKACRADPPKLLILDIEMPGLTGFDVVKKLQADDMPSIIFATAYDNYAIDAFDLNAVDYLLKAFRQRSLRHCDRASKNAAFIRCLAKRATDQCVQTDSENCG